MNGSSGAAPRRRTERAMSLAGGKPIDRFASGRVCAHPSCGSTLSRYNPNPTCSAHGGWEVTKQRRNR